MLTLPIKVFLLKFEDATSRFDPADSIVLLPDIDVIFLQRIEKEIYRHSYFLDKTIAPPLVDHTFHRPTKS